MKVLVTGGTGIIGAPAVRELLASGHQVRLLSRSAQKDARQFAGEVEAHDGSVGDSEEVKGSAKGCDAILHIAGIIREDPPSITFESVNVNGTRHIVEEAERSGVRRLVFVSSLGANRGSSGYHRSKFQAETLVRDFSRDWLILRPGGVIGPGDELISLMIRMMRTLPAVPVIDGGDQRSQPIWYEDLAKAIVAALERDGLVRQTMNLAGEEVVTTNSMLNRLELLIGKKPLRIPVPAVVATMGTSMLSGAGIDVPFTEDQVSMLIEENRIQEGETNALTEVLGIQPISWNEALQQLLLIQPEQPSGDGIGEMVKHSYKAVIQNSGVSAEELFSRVRANFGRLFEDAGIEADPEGLEQPFDRGCTLTLELPARGTVQVRVLECEPAGATLVTLAGHPLAGMVRMEASDGEDGLRFHVQTWDRPSSVPDAAAMATIGRAAQEGAWQSFLENVVALSGGNCSEAIESERDTLDASEAKDVDAWCEALMHKLRREESARAHLF